MNFDFWPEIVFAIILGITQGATEFLPISSTAHMRLISEFITGKDFGSATSNIIQLGTLVAVVQYFWHDLNLLFKHLIKITTIKKEFTEFYKNSWNWIKSKNLFLDDESDVAKDILIAQLIIGTLPILIIGFLVRDYIDIIRENILWIALFLILGSIMMFFSDKLHNYRIKQKRNLDLLVGRDSIYDKDNQNKSNQELTQETRMFTFKKVLFIGFFQVLAILPGISRSGATLSGALFLGRNRAKSVRFSFLLSIPAIGISSFYDFFKIIFVSENNLSILPKISNLDSEIISFSLVSIFFAVIFSYFVGLFFLKWLLRYLAKNSTTIFIVYRFLLSLIIVLLL